MLDERTMRPSALLDYIDALSPQAAVWRAIEPDMVWTLDAMLLAALVDEIRVLRWEFERANFKGRQQQPDAIPRPGVTSKPEVDVIGGGDGFDTIAEFDEWYARQFSASA